MSCSFDRSSHFRCFRHSIQPLLLWGICERRHCSENEPARRRNRQRVYGKLPLQLKYRTRLNIPWLVIGIASFLDFRCSLFVTSTYVFLTDKVFVENFFHSLSLDVVGVLCHAYSMVFSKRRDSRNACSDPQTGADHVL